MLQLVAEFSLEKVFGQIPPAEKVIPNLFLILLWEKMKNEKDNQPTVDFKYKYKFLRDLDKAPEEDIVLNIDSCGLSLVGYEREGGVLVSRNAYYCEPGKAEGHIVTCIDCFYLKKSILKTLYRHNDCVTCVSCSLNYDSTLLALTLKTRQLINHPSLPQYQDLYESAVTEISGNKPKYHGFNKITEEPQLIQFIGPPEKKKESSFRSDFICFIYSRRFGIYEIPCKEISGTVKIVTHPVGKDIVESLVWHQWVPQKPLLYLIEKSKISNSRSSSTMDTLICYSFTSRTANVVFKCPVPALSHKDRIFIVKLATGDDTNVVVCKQHAPVPQSASVFITLSFLNHDAIVELEVPLGAYPQLNLDEVVVFFDNIGDLLLIYIPGFYLQLINCSFDEEPQMSLCFSGSDFATPLPHQLSDKLPANISHFTQYKDGLSNSARSKLPTLLDNTTGTIYRYNFNRETILKMFKESESLSLYDSPPLLTVPPSPRSSVNPLSCSSGSSSPYAQFLHRHQSIPSSMNSHARTPSHSPDTPTRTMSRTQRQSASAPSQTLSDHSGSSPISTLLSRSIPDTLINEFYTVPIDPVGEKRNTLKSHISDIFTASRNKLKGCNKTTQTISKRSKASSFDKTAHIQALNLAALHMQDTELVEEIMLQVCRNHTKQAPCELLEEYLLAITFTEFSHQLPEFLTEKMKCTPQQHNMWLNFCLSTFPLTTLPKLKDGKGNGSSFYQYRSFPFLPKRRRINVQTRISFDSDSLAFLGSSSPYSNRRAPSSGSGSGSGVGGGVGEITRSPSTAGLPGMIPPPSPPLTRLIEKFFGGGSSNKDTDEYRNEKVMSEPMTLTSSGGSNYGGGSGSASGSGGDNLRSSSSNSASTSSHYNTPPTTALNSLTSVSSSHNSGEINSTNNPSSSSSSHQKTVERLGNYIMGLLPKEIRIKWQVYEVASLYKDCQLKQAKVLFESIRREVPAEEDKLSTFFRYCNLYSALEEVGFPCPPEFQETITSLGYHCLSRSVFVQFLLGGVFAITPNFVEKVIPALSVSSQEDLQFRYLLLSKLSEELSIRLLESELSKTPNSNEQEFLLEYKVRHHNTQVVDMEDMVDADFLPLSIYLESLKQSPFAPQELNWMVQTATKEYAEGLLPFGDKKEELDGGLKGYWTRAIRKYD